MRCSLVRAGDSRRVHPMRQLLIVAIHLLVTFASPISNRSRQRAPNLTTLDRVVLGRTTLLVSLLRIAKLGALIKPASLFKFNKALIERKFRLVFSFSPHRRKRCPKGPSVELVAAIVEMRRRNPRFGCVRIAQQVSHVFSIAIDKEVVRRLLKRHNRPGDTGSEVLAGCHASHEPRIASGAARPKRTSGVPRGATFATARRNPAIRPKTTPDPS